MTDLERQLLDLGSALETPATPDLMEAVRMRLAPRRKRRRRPMRHRRRAVALAVAFTALFVGTAAAVPPVRNAIERIFGLRGATVERVPSLPPLPGGQSRNLNLGRRIPVAAARRAASFRALLPPGRVDAAYLSQDVAGGRITVTVGRLLVMEFRGQSMPYILKFIGPGTRVRMVRVDGSAGIYLDHAPHEVLFLDARGDVRMDTIRLAGNVLLWQQGALIVRIEGSASLSEALGVARLLR